MILDEILRKTVFTTRIKVVSSKGETLIEPCECQDRKKQNYEAVKYRELECIEHCLFNDYITFYVL